MQNYLKVNKSMKDFLNKNILQDLPKDKVTALATDVAGLKKELREVARKETEEVR